jgi:hypothetical protein
MLDAAVDDVVDGDDDLHLRPDDAIELDGKIYVVQSHVSDPKGYVVSDPDVIGVDRPSHRH